MNLPLNTSEQLMLSVSELTQAIKGLLENEFNHVCVKGEISNLTKHSSGHWYFSLKDQGAQIQCAMFRNANKSVSFPVKNGDQVLVTGSLSVYPPRGNYQMICRSMQLQGLGSLLLQLEELKKQLQSKGYFDSSIKKAIPENPQVIGVITSPTGAAVRDIIHVLNRRFIGKKIILNPVKVQGPGSAEEVAKAINQMNTYSLADVLIIGRGGGSIEDLWAFNELVVAEAIYNSQIPIISAVGHETDFTISDLVADIRAPTPSAAAEVVTKSRDEAFSRLKQLNKQFNDTIMHKLRSHKKDFNFYLKSTVLEKPTRILEPLFQQLDDYDEELNQSTLRYLQQQTSSLNHFKHILQIHQPLDRIKRQIKILNDYSIQFRRYIELKLKSINEKLQQNTQILDQSILNHINRFSYFLNSIQNTTQATHPKHLLSRGFSIISGSEGKIIHSVKDIHEGKKLYITLSDGTISLNPNNIIKHTKEAL